MTKQELHDAISGAATRAKAISAAAEAEARDITAEEEAELSALVSASDTAHAQLKRLEAAERVALLASRVEPEPVRRTQPVDLEPARITGGMKVGATTATSGFQNFAEFALAARAGSARGAIPDKRLFAAAPSTYSTEGTGADGGYLVPPDFRTEILKKVLGEESLLGRTDQYFTTSNSVTIPSDETTPWDTTKGIQAAWEGEGQPLTQSKPALQSVFVRANKITALVPVTDEQIQDAPQLEGYLRTKVPDKFNFRLNDAILNGDGVGKPLGYLNSPALVTQAAASGQTAGTVVFANITGMWSRMYAPSRRRAVWLINQDVEPQLQALTVPGGGTTIPAYLPPGGLSSSPYATLMGRPVIVTEACQALGTPGDIVLADLGAYMSVLKAGGIRSDVSIHLWFDYDVTAFRFVMRVGGQPWWSAPITRAKSALTLSCAVDLAQR